MPNTLKTPLSIPAPEQILSVDVVISSAELLALNATPKSLVPAPGASLALVFEGAVIHKPAGSAYAAIHADDDISFKYTDASGTALGECEATGFLDQTTAQTRYVRPYNAASAESSLEPTANAAIVAHMLTGEVTTGNSALHVRVFYRVVPCFAFGS